MGMDLVTIGKNALSELKNITYKFVPGFNTENALKGAELIFRENNNFPNCTDDSKYKAVFNMLVQGLNPLKGQCHFVPFGKTLQLIVDYSGSVMVAKNCDPRIMDVRSKVVRRGEPINLENINGLTLISGHKPSFETHDNEIIGTYAIAVDDENKVLYSDMMTYKSVIDGWKQANLRVKGEPVVRQDGSLHPLSNHFKYHEKMVKKTVIKRMCTEIIKMSPNEILASASDESIEVEEIKSIDVQSLQPKNIEHEVIDFDPSDPPAATPEQGHTIVELYKQIDPEGDVMANVSSHFNRQINRLRELTESEANHYINSLGLRLQHQNEVKQKISEEEKDDDEKPDWL